MSTVGHILDTPELFLLVPREKGQMKLLLFSMSFLQLQ